MRLEPPKDFTVHNHDGTPPASANPNHVTGGVYWFPWVCDTCHVVYWYRPGDCAEAGELSSDCCTEQWASQIEGSGTDDSGTRFWRALAAEVRRPKDD